MKKPDSVQSSSKLARTSLAALEKAVEKLGGTPRAGQELMAQTVAEIADEGGHLLVQAGTGNGLCGAKRAGGGSFHGYLGAAAPNRH